MTPIKASIAQAVALSALCMILMHSSAPAQQASYADGVKAYNQGHYSQAITLLKACADGPQGKGSQADLIHYYLGMAYQAANQRGLASSEYTWVYNNSRNAALKANAAVGFQRLGGKSQAMPVSSATGGGVVSPAAGAQALPRGGLCSRDPKTFFIDKREYLGGLLDCGPACMIMIFKAFNKFPPNFPSDPAKMVSAERHLMTGKDDQEQYSTVDHILNGAHQAGYRTDRFDGLERLDYWLKQGVPVISLGAPNGPGCFGPRAGYASTQAADAGHYLVITHLQNGVYGVNDINQPGPIEMTNAEMTAWINGNGFNGRYQLRNVALSP